MSDKVTKTFEEWSNSGFKIKKGSKSIGRNSDGKCIFSSYQVELKPVMYGRYYGDGDYTDEDYEITNYELCAGEWGD